MLSVCILVERGRYVWSKNSQTGSSCEPGKDACENAFSVAVSSVHAVCRTMLLQPRPQRRGSDTHLRHALQLGMSHCRIRVLKANGNVVAGSVK